MRQNERRVVITGLGLISPLGIGLDANWSALAALRTGVGRIEAFPVAGLPGDAGGEVKGFDPKALAIPKHKKALAKSLKYMARDIQLAVAAAEIAITDAGLADGGVDPTRFGLDLGAGLISTELDELAPAINTATEPDNSFDFARYGREGIPQITPIWLLKYLPNMLACHVTIIHGAEGPSNTITCAEASGLLSLGESLRVIERDAADLCFSGGAESKINLMGLLRLDLMRRLAATNGATDGAALVRPYDPAATGGLAGEAGGIVVLEEEGKARARAARVYARVAGFGAAQSPARLDEPARGADVQRFFECSGEGLGDAIERALEDAEIAAGRVDAIVPLGSGVPTADAAEAAALRGVFGARLGEIPLVTLSPSIGECMAGGGALRVAAGAMAIKEQRLPARIHGGRAAEGLRAEAAPARGAALKNVLVCTSSLGGQNAAIVLTAAA